MSNEITFNLSVMKEFAKHDKLISRMVSELGNNEYAYQVVFNSEILYDSAMENEYLNIAHKLGITP